MGSSTLHTNQDTSTTKQRKGSKDKPAANTLKPLSFVSGNDALPSKRTPSKTSPIKTEDIVRVSVQVSPKTKSPPSESTSQPTADDLEWFPADPFGTVNDSDKSLKSKKKLLKIQSSSTHASWVELIMGFLIILCIIYPGMIGKLPWVPRLLYEAFDPFSWHA